MQSMAAEGRGLVIYEHLEGDGIGLRAKTPDRFYSLALVLRGDELSAEKCVLAAFDSCAEGKRVLFFNETTLL